MQRRPTLWLAAAVAALSLLSLVLAWQRQHVPGRSASFLSGNPAQGAFLFESKGCSQCHSISGSGGHVAADLGS